MLSTPVSAMNRSLSARLKSCGAAVSGATTWSGSRSNVTATEETLNANASATVLRSSSLCPTCTPSNTPMAMTASPNESISLDHVMTLVFTVLLPQRRRE